MEDYSNWNLQIQIIAAEVPTLHRIVLRSGRVSVKFDLVLYRPR